MRRYAEITAWLLPERLASDGEAGRLRFEATLRQLHGDGRGLSAS
jgi:hypothetical protein